MITALSSSARAVSVLCCALLSLTAAAQDWVWSSGQVGNNDVRYFRKPFRLGDAPEKAVLAVACDNKAAIYVDGKLVGESDDWNQPTTIDLARSLKAGDHLLAVRAENQGGAAGLIARFDIAFPTTKKQSIQTDATWLVSDKEVPGCNKLETEVPGFTAATSLGKHGVQPWGAVFAAATPARAPGAPRRGEATPVESLKVADGFKAEL